MIIDSHLHIFDRIQGRNRFGAVTSGSNGCLLVNGEPKPFLPDSFGSCCFSAATAIKMMDDHCVDKALLLQNPTLGIVNETIRDAIHDYPGRFAGTIQMDPRTPDRLETIQTFASPLQNTLKLELSYDWGWAGIYPGFSLSELQDVFELADGLGLRILIDPGPVQNPGYQIEAIGQLAEQYPDMAFLLAHLGYLQGDEWEHREIRARRMELIGLAGKNNVYLDYSAVGILLGESAPGSRSLNLIKEAVETVGADKILWGSDAPGTLTPSSYRKLLDEVLVHAGFLSDEQRSAIMGGNADRLFFGGEIHV